MEQAVLIPHNALAQQNEEAVSTLQNTQEKRKKENSEIERAKRAKAVLKENHNVKADELMRQNQLVNVEVMEYCESEEAATMDTNLMFNDQMSSEQHSMNPEPVQKKVRNTNPIIIDLSSSSASCSPLCSEKRVKGSNLKLSKKLILKGQHGKKRKANETDDETSHENQSAHKRIHFTKALPSLSDKQPSSTVMENLSCTSSASSSGHVQNKQNGEIADMVSVRAEIACLQNLCKLRLSPLHSPPHIEDTCDDVNVSIRRSAFLSMHVNCSSSSLNVGAKFTSEMYCNLKKNRLKQNMHTEFECVRIPSGIGENPFITALENLERHGRSSDFMQSCYRNLVNSMVNPSAVTNVNSVVIIFLDKIASLTRKQSLLPLPDVEMLDVTEKCIAMSIVQAEKQKPHLYNLVKLFLQEASEKILQNTLHDTQTSSSLCRIFTLICKINNNIQDPQFLCQKIIEHCPGTSRHLIRIMVNVWNVLHDTPEAALAISHSAEVELLTPILKSQDKSDKQSKEKFSLVFIKGMKPLKVLSSDVQENASSVNICSNSSEMLLAKSSKTNIIIKKCLLTDGQNLGTHTKLPIIRENWSQNTMTVFGFKTHLYSSGNSASDFSNNDSPSEPSCSYATPNYLANSNDNARVHTTYQPENSSSGIPSNSNVHEEHIAVFSSNVRSSHVEVEIPDSSGIPVLSETESAHSEQEESSDEISPSYHLEPQPISESSDDSSDVPIPILPNEDEQEQSERTSYNNVVTSTNTILPECQPLDLLRSLLNKLNQLRFNKKLFKGLRRSLVKALINCSATESAKSVAKLLISYIISSKRDPLLSFLNSFNTRTLTPLIEICLTDAIIQAEKKDETHLNGLVEILLIHINVKILYKKRLPFPSVSALVRVFTLICKKNKTPERPRVLYRKIFQFRPELFHLLFASMIGVWNEILPPASDFTTTIAVQKVRECIFMQKPEKLKRRYWKRCQLVFKKLCDFSEGSSVNSTPLVLVIVGILLGAQYSSWELKEYEILLELLVVQCGWTFAKSLVLDVVLYNALRTLFNGFNSSVNIPALAVLIRLIGIIDQLSPKDNSACLNFFDCNMKCLFNLWDKDYLPICEALHFCLLQIHINHEKQVPIWLSNWLDDHKREFSKESMSWIEMLNRC